MVTISSFLSAYPTTGATSTARTAATTNASAATTVASEKASPTTRSSGAAGAVKLEFDQAKPRTADSLRDQLRTKLNDVLGGIYKDKDQRAQATEESLKSLSSQIDKAASSKDVKGVEIRVGSVNTNYGLSSSVRSIGIEVGLVRDKKVSSSDTTVLDYQGKTVGLSAKEVASGLVNGAYSTTGQLPADASSAGSAALEKARTALSKVQQTSDALKAFRNGDSGPLDELRAQMQGGKSSVSTASQSAPSDPTAALMSRDPKVRQQMLSQMMANHYGQFVR
ncbi:hypothetical protein IGS68_16105 [Skermanella sp. TT6]|uniref:Flagellar hook-associated protein 2 C-terminal domain-containing protein n=1 Tax=Skermanella cutis TaxID=2775420 RepID=A0ABX7B047_9PROT|nr:hypothetical protein [Skermanella sp. TT6]QQP87621.1 hypothetical protein IGS68_16105 [Skermanella sp. TT6]